VSRFVFDTSALLVLLHHEPGIENLPSPSDMMRGGIISSVNLTEAHGRLILEGFSEAFAWEAVTTPLGEIAEYSAAHARRAGALIAQTRSLGLSLGDRACLALAIELGVPVYTADRPWSGFDLGIPIHVIR
jgi:ribonuclease VapC